MGASIIILSGERGVGKSTVCRRTVALARERGYICGGIITLHSPDDNLDVLDVQSGDVRRLTLGPESSGPAVIQGRFRFDPRTLSWGNNVLARVAACDLLVVDELGPLEIERDWGWQQAFWVLRSSDFALALVVVRPELIVPAQIRLSVSAETVFTVTTQDRDDIPAVLLETLENLHKSRGGE